MTKVMVIGDSLAQGCRSLTVRSDFCAQSCTARIAAAARWPFVPPRHPRPVLFDLEQEIRNLPLSSISAGGIKLDGGFVGRVLENLHFWRHKGPEDVRCFDDLGITGCLVADLYERTAALCKDEVRQVAGDMPLFTLKLDQLGKLHIAINGGYILNPSQDPALDHLSPLDWVKERKPEVLFVQVGHNHGLFAAGFSADVKNPKDAEVSITQSGFGKDAQGNELGPTFWEQWKIVSDKLARLPDAVKHIVVFLLPKVGAVGNLRPLGIERDADGYAPAYEPVFSMHRGVPGSVIESVDQAIQSVNGKIVNLLTDSATRVGNVGRLKFVNTYEIIRKYDFKNTGDPARRVPITDTVIVDNRYLDGRAGSLLDRHGNSVLSQGGFFSIDGMHPSGVGYAILASEALNVLGFQHDAQALREAAFREDALLSDYPANLDVVVRLLAALRGHVAKSRGGPAPSPVLSTDSELADVVHGIKSLFIR